MLTSPTTELEAVNIMLSGIGETPVNSLLGELTTDVSLAKTILAEVSKETQSEGWTWNTERNYPLSINSNNEILLSPTVLNVIFREPDVRLYAVRGRKLYDLQKHTFKFETLPVIHNMSVILFLDFDEIPETARRYITIKALRIFQERTVGSQLLSQYQRDDEQRARAKLLSDDLKMGRQNMLQGVTAPNTHGYHSFLPMLGRW